jgi:hypothetical protein
MSQFFCRYKSQETGKTIWSINEAHCPNLAFGDGRFRFAVRTFHWVYAIAWYRGKGWSFERKPCAPKWLEPVLVTIGNMHIRIYELEKEQKSRSSERTIEGVHLCHPG